MFKFLTTLLFFIFLSISIGKTEILKEIKIDGNQRISKETIIVLGKIEINTNYNNYRCY